MPAGKYYCDYCDKEFQDTQAARKRHLLSNSHLRAKALWYSDMNPQPPSSVTRALCNRFVTSNFCPFGDSCRFVHPHNNPGSSGFTQMLNQPQLQGSNLNRGYDGSGGRGTSWSHLPPSLKPPPEHGYPQLPSIDWGG